MLLGALKVTVDEEERGKEKERSSIVPVVLARTLIDRVYTMPAASAAAHS